MAGTRRCSMSDQSISEEILMSTSAVSGTSISQDLHQYFQTRESDLKQLGLALRNGDLAGAQAAYSNIVSLGQTGSLGSGNSFYRASLQKDFSNVGRALQSGDLVGAQHQFAALRATLQRGAQQLDPPPSSPAP